MRNKLRNLSRSFISGKRFLIVIALVALLIVPQSSEASFIPVPCCPIVASGLGSIASAITNVIGGALNAINATMSSIEAFERTVVWPQNLIDEARAAVGALRGIFNQIRGLGQIPVSSATLPNTRQLEQTLLSGNAALINALHSPYTTLYSP